MRDSLPRHMIRTFEIVLGVVLVIAAARSAAAQTPGKPWDLSCEKKVIDNKYYLCEGQVEFVQGGAETDTKVYSDRLEWFSDEDRAIATGNVVFKQGRNQIAADRAEFEDGLLSLRRIPRRTAGDAEPDQPESAR